MSSTRLELYGSVTEDGSVQPASASTPTGHGPPADPVYIFFGWTSTYIFFGWTSTLAASTLSPWRSCNANTRRCLSMRTASVVS